MAGLAASLHGNEALLALNLASNELCGINSFGQGTYTAHGVEAVAQALGKCALRVLDLSSNCLAGLVVLTGRSMGSFHNDAVEVELLERGRLVRLSHRHEHVLTDVSLSLSLARGGPPLPLQAANCLQRLRILLDRLITGKLEIVTVENLKS